MSGIGSNMKEALKFKLKKFFIKELWRKAPQFCDRAGWYLLRRGVIQGTKVYLAFNEYIEPETEILFLHD